MIKYKNYVINKYSFQIQKALADCNATVCILDKSYIQLKIVFKSQEQLENSLQYLKNNLPQFYHRFEKVDDKYYIVLDKNLSVDQQIVYHNCDAPELAEYTQKYQIIDMHKAAEIHIFNNNVMILLLSHANCDGGYAKKLLSLMSQQQKQEISLITSEYKVFEEQLKIYNQKLHNNEYTFKYQNKFDVIENQKPQKLYICTVKMNLQQYPYLQHKLSWKLIIINSLYKLYVLQKQQKLQNIETLLNDGIAMIQSYIVDARRYMQQKLDAGCYALSINENYLLIGSKTIKTYCEEFQKSFEERSNNYEQYGFLQMFIDIMNQKHYEINTKIIASYLFSNIGFANNENYLSCELDLQTKQKDVDQVTSFSFTFNNQAQFRFHCPEEYKNYNVEKIITKLMQNMNDDVTIIQLWDLIKNE